MLTFAPNSGASNLLWSFSLKIFVRNRNTWCRNIFDSRYVPDGSVDNFSFVVHFDILNRIFFNFEPEIS